MLDDKEKFIDRYLDGTPSELVLRLECEGRSLDADILKRLLLDISSVREFGFVEMVFWDIDEVDEILKDPSVMRTILRADGRFIFDATAANYNYLDSWKLLQPVLERRPGVLFRYYLRELPCDMMENHRKYGGFSKFEEAIYTIVLAMRDKPEFPRDIFRKIESVHDGIWKKLMYLN